MEIFINGKPADITLDGEKVLGDVMTGIEQWVFPTGARIKNISVNGKDIPGDGLGDAFRAGVDEIAKLDVFISPWRDFATEALEDLYKTCLLYEKASFAERADIFAAWENSSAARFLTSDIPDIHDMARRSLSGEGLSPSDLNTLIAERLSEITDPERETTGAGARIKMIAGRLEELPLDMQTGKDQRAAETMRLFSNVSEKLFRLFFIYKLEGLQLDTFMVDNLPVKKFMADFNAALKELFSAYENQDTVLAGDIAEYELAPRLLQFFEALDNISKSGSPVLSES